MSWQGSWKSLLAVVIFPAILHAAEPSKTGIVKGVVTVAGRPTADAVVSVEGLPKEKVEPRNAKPKAPTAVMSQRDLRFIPRVLPVLAGTTVEFPNNDKSWHNVISKSEAKKFDLGLYPPGKTRSVVFDRVGVVKILCNVHPNMEAYVVVKGHPYFSAPDNRGNFQISGVPLGRYRLEVWSPDFGTRVVPFEVAREGEVLSLDVELKTK